MNDIFRQISCLLLVVFLVSCASTGERDNNVVAPAQGETGNYKYEAWRLSASGEYEAINVLLDEADVLIENHAFNAATDKLERVLRIKPEYAPAWSRLSWLALQMNSPKRSVQMAKRSNSFALSDPGLQSLNWSFIRAASKELNDEDSFHRANQKIKSLKTF
ncbi:MAG: hypothetical protein BMS9Abin19_0869 [Gammaproteobacteria bacterium]|nr:MAG: hypothetical protein BMS9Abin19_0869 [Gammaproteobacteria bacterium]